MKNVINNKYYFLLFIALLIYSFASIFSKIASFYLDRLFIFVLYYLMVIFLLAIYAVLWQQVLKHIDLSVAMSFKPLVLVLDCIWACVIFKEYFSLKIIIGIILIIIGLIYIGFHNE